MSEIPRYWRLQGQRYNLLGEKCDECGKVSLATGKRHIHRELEMKQKSSTDFLIFSATEVSMSSK